MNIADLKFEKHPSYSYQTATIPLPCGCHIMVCEFFDDMWASNHQEWAIYHYSPEQMGIHTIVTQYQSLLAAQAILYDFLATHGGKCDNQAQVPGDQREGASESAHSQSQR